MKAYRGIRAGKVAYLKYFKEQERVLSLVRKLYNNDAQDIIEQAKHLSETTTLTFQKALYQVIEKYKK